jgi:ADP-ribose pyrophosphatase YjhB (NUDIX family)
VVFGESDTLADERIYPSRPFLAASAAILREGKILVVRRARPPANGVFSLPGGVVETGETLHEAVTREVLEETGLTIEPVALAGYRETIVRDKDARVERHFVILPFAARWVAGEPVLNDELSEWRWVGCPADDARPRGHRRGRGGATEGRVRRAALMPANVRPHLPFFRRLERSLMGSFAGNARGSMGL